MTDPQSQFLAEAYRAVYEPQEQNKYQLVVDYLVSEGYVDDEAEAEVVIEELEDEVIDGILDEIRTDIGGKINPDTGYCENGSGSAEMLWPPRKKARLMANRREKEATTPRHFRQAEKMRRVAANMKEEYEDLEEGRADKNLTPLQKIRKRNQDSSLVMSAGGKTSERRSYHEAGRGMKKTKGEKSAFGTMRNVGGPYKEETDTYDLVLDYLLDEGYADTEESALKIMSNMSEEWVDSIIEEAVRGSERSIGNIITGNDIRSVSRGKTSVYKKPNWQDRVETNVRRKMGKEGHRNPYQYGSELTKQARKSAERMNAIKNVEVKYGYDDDNTSIDREGYREVPTDYRARRRRASGR